MKSERTGFDRLNLDEAKKIADIISFDVAQCFANARSCGYSRYYLENDKRYYVIMLLKHISAMIDEAEKLPDDVKTWYQKAKLAYQEYRAIEEHHLKMRSRPTGHMRKNA